jgi:WXXGXW repeat (2 copies)
MVRTTKCLCLFLLACATLAIPSIAAAQISVGVSIHIGPPPLPVYLQPMCPGPGYIWTPGYWAYGPDGYYWVPGTWVVAPRVGVLWTPGYWGWGGGVYLWHAGYWGPHVGFYGGINYGFGYGGVGFVGGEWRGGVYNYNTAVSNVNTTVIRNTYVNNTTVINNNSNINRVSYNGGTGGVTAQPTAREQAAAREQHIPATTMQTQHEQTARNDRSLLASVNHGRPAVAATAKPGVFQGPGVVAAHAPSANASRPVPRPSTNTANNRNSAMPNSAPRPRANNTANSSNNHPNNNHPNMARASMSHPNQSRPPQPNHPPKPHEHQGGGQPGERVNR